MTIETINHVMREARRRVGDEGAVLLLLIAAGRLAERLRIPLVELLAVLASSYRASASTAPGGPGTPPGSWSPGSGRRSLRLP
jgi:hypothetical protein